MTQHAQQPHEQAAAAAAHHVYQPVNTDPWPAASLTRGELRALIRSAVFTGGLLASLVIGLLTILIWMIVGALQDSLDNRRRFGSVPAIENCRGDAMAHAVDPTSQPRTWELRQSL